ncbi:DUF2339 domain-containing protein [Nocardia huaxiensis]|uniref:DUF2339 domain-containing protein n=1 Tax=Nocardia huaxiensis TaxID=2755382 RepID=A0A7D6VB40_9NOCA|nr:DUF2339 domain-containing protein [Nocardia huaxiensis]QLY30893.1 DUF2339 domain-containing protein [Nocardia huaxiensis]
MPGIPQRRMAPPREVRPPWWQREGVISRVLAVAGVGVTLIGVVMLLVLAAQAGFFGPVPRVVAGAVFSGALVAAAVRVHGRAGGYVGAVALAATGIAGGYLDVVAVTSIYDWVHPVAGLAVAFGIAAAGVWLAVQWRSQALAVLVVLGAAVLSPVITTEMALLAFLLVLQIAAVPVQLGRDWPYLHIVRTVPAALAILISVAAVGFEGRRSGSIREEVLAAAIVAAVAGLAGAILVVRRRAGDLTASVSFAAAGIPLVAATAMFERAGAVSLAVGYAVVLFAVAVLPWVPKLGAAARIPGHLAIVSAVVGACSLLIGCFRATTFETLPIALFLVALGFLAVGAQQRSKVAAWIGAAFAGLGAGVFLDIAAPGMLAGQRSAEAHLGVSTALAAVAALGVVAVALWCARRIGLLGSENTTSTAAVLAGILGLYAVTVLTVSVGVATGDKDGFLAGHGIATIIWMVTATAALLFGLRRLARTPQQAKVALAGGLLVTAAALAKLFLFDLATLDGLVRAAAFLAVGVLLLVAGTRYARAFAEAADRETPAP